MWAQVKVKRTLAWSTVNQMSFMMIQCGLAAFPAPLLHIVGHGCYKAWSFLASGEVHHEHDPVRRGRRDKATTDSTTPLFAVIFLTGTGLSVPAIAPASWITGFAPLHSAGELALSMIVGLSVGQLWLALFGPLASDRAITFTRITGALLATTLLVVAAFALYQGAAMFLAPVLGELPVPSGPLAWAAAAAPVIAPLLLTMVQALLPTFGHTSSGRAFYVHALHGFYFGVIADEVVDRIWRSVFDWSVSHEDAGEEPSLRCLAFSHQSLTLRLLTEHI